MKGKFLCVLSVLLCGLFSAQASWWVRVSPGAAGHLGFSSQGPFATQAAAQAWVNANCPNISGVSISGSNDVPAQNNPQNNNQAAAAAAEKKAQEEAARRQAEAQAAADKAARDAEQARLFEKAKAAALGELKGLDFDSSGRGSALKGLNDTPPRKGTAVTPNLGLRDALNDNGSQLKSLDAQPAPFVITDAMVVDARNVPTGLPKFVQDSIPHTPAGDRVRKGFQAVLNHDWPVALAWFQDALNKKPGDAGLERLVDLARFTLNYRNHPPAPAALASPAPPAAALQPLPVPAGLEVALKEKLNEDLAKAMDDYNEHRLSLPPNPNEHIMTDEEFFKMEDPAWIQFCRYVTYLLPQPSRPPPRATIGGIRG